MKKTFSLCAFFLLANLSITFAGDGITNWKINFESSKVFIENKGQFKLPDGTETVLYAIDNGASKIYFTKAGVTYSFKKIIPKEKESIEERAKEKFETAEEWMEEEKKEKHVDFESDVINMVWANANPNAVVIANEKAVEYFSYSIIENGDQRDINFIPAFKKITYKNLYPGIDVEYVFHQIEGIKYSFIIHPGADASLIQMKYSGSKNLVLQNNGDLKIETLFGAITDHAPQTFYASTKSIIISSFTLNQNIVSFSLNNYDNTQEIIIDPWTVNPAMPNSQKVWEIETDSAGNAYIYGGDWPNCKLQKYNLAGAIQWTNITPGYDSSAWIGTLATDLVGNCYVTIGSSAAIKKVSTASVTQWNTGGGFLDEYWSLAFNCDYTKLICGGTRLIGFPLPTGSGRAFDINLSNGSVINSVKVANALPSFLINDPNEIRSICSSPDGNYYFHTLDTIGALTTALGINWRLLTSYSYAYSSPSYGFTPQPQHVIRATSNYIYTMNGQTIFRRNIATGAVINQAAIPGGGYTDPLFVQGIAPNNNGIAIDSCGNVYVGSTNRVVKYDANLNLITSVTTPTVYDVAIGKNGEVLVCGNGFASSINMSACPQSKKINCVSLGTSPTSAFTISDNSICPNTCINFTDQSTNTPTSWSWTFAGGNPASSSSQNPGSVCFAAPGSHTVSLLVSNATGSNSSSQTVTVFNSPTANAGNNVAICAGSSTVLSASGGSTYSWSPSAGLNNSTSASPTASPTATTTYTVTVTNAELCTSTDAVVVTVNSLPNVSVTPSVFSLCKGQGTQLTASGGITYSWSPSAGLSGTSGSSVFAIPTVSTTYTVTGVNALGCSATATSAISVTDQPFVIASITNDSPCPGSGAIAISIIGGAAPFNFTWSTGATSQNLANLVAGNYTLTVTSGPCTVVTTYTVSPGTYNPTLTVTNLYSCSARLNWTATPTASYYKVRYKVSGAATWSAQVNVGANLFYDFAGLVSNTTYNFQVAAFCASNQNLGWRTKNGKTQLCTSPISPTITNLTNTSATISWTTACSPVSFVFRYRMTGAATWTNVGTASTTYTINNLVNATQYEFQVRSNCGVGINSALTALQTFTTAPRLENTEVENSFSIFPNPNTGSFTLQIPSLKMESQISIYNIVGQLVYNSSIAAGKNASSQKILLENIADGLYEVVLNNEELTLTKRLIILK